MSCLLVGCGHFGKNHARILNRNGDLAAVCDLMPENLLSLPSRTGQDYTGVAMLNNLEDALSVPGVRQVFIATPASTHYELARKALDRGMDVFVEKPLALSSDHAERLHEISQAKELIVMVDHVVNYEPVMPFLCDLVRRKEFGDIKRVVTRRLMFSPETGDSRNDLDVVWAMGIHDISVVLRLMRIGGFSLNESSVKALSTTTILNQKDSLTTTSSFFNEVGKNAVWDMQLSWVDAEKLRSLQIVFERGMVFWDQVQPRDDKGALKVFNFNKSSEPEETLLYSGETAGEPPLEEAVRTFLSCCRDRTRPLTDAFEAVGALRFCELVSPITGPPPAAQKRVTSAQDYFVHPSAVVDPGANVGKSTKIWHFAHVCKEATIGENCTIGQNVFVADGAILGNGVKVQNNISVYDGVVCEDNVFLGPGTCFTNDRVPRAKYPCPTTHPFVQTYIKVGASIGANATIVCGVTLGKHCFVGAGAVVTKDVADYSLVYGNPASHKAWITEDGVPVQQHPETLAEQPLPEWKKDENKNIVATEAAAEKIPLMNLRLENDQIIDHVARAIKEVCLSSQFIGTPPTVIELEKRLAERVGVPYCVGVASGTHAIQVALMAVGVEPGDEVIVPTFTYVATANAAAVLGAIPVFVDVLPDTYNMDPQAVKAALTKRTKAVIPVSLFGRIADIPGIQAVLKEAGRSDVTVIEDAAQSFGARSIAGCSGGISELGITSFMPAKVLGCFGCGGAIFVKNKELYEKIRRIHVHGRMGSTGYYHTEIGTNSMLDNIQAVVLLAKLDHTFDRALASRRDSTRLYNKLLADVDGIQIPTADPAESACALYVVQVSESVGRDAVQKEMEELGASTRVYYPLALHRQPAFQSDRAVTSHACPVADQATKVVLALPLSAFMPTEHVVEVVRRLKSVVQKLRSA